MLMKLVRYESQQNFISVHFILLSFMSFFRFIFPKKCVEMGASQERFLECEENEPCDRYVNIGYQGYIR